MSRRKTLLAGEIPKFDVQDDEVDDDEEKRRRVSERFNPSAISITRKALPKQDSDNRSAANKTLTTPNASVPKPSNEQLSCLYNNCVKLLNENKINVKNAFQLKLIDYMSDIVLNKDIVGGVTNFQVVGCTIDVGTKIYAARVDALHQNTYQMLSGLGHQNQDDQNENNENNMNQSHFKNNDDDNDDDLDENAANKRAKTAKKKRMKRSSQISENLDQITNNKMRDEFQDEDLYFSKISTCIENEAVAGTLLNKLHFIDDSNKIYINSMDKLRSTCSSHQNITFNNTGIDLNLKDICDFYKAKNLTLTNLKLCSDISSFRFIGWSLDTNDEISKFVEQVAAPEEDLEMHRFDANNIQTSHLNISLSQGISSAPGMCDIDVDNDFGGIDMNDVENIERTMADGGGQGIESLQQHQSGMEIIDDIRSLNSVAELTHLVAQSPNEYSYFDKFKMHNLRSNLRQLASAASSQNPNLLEPIKSTATTATTTTVRNRREAPRIDLSILTDRMKFFKVTKKAIYLCDRTIEKRSEKPLRMECERQYEYNPRELFQPYLKPITAKIYSDLDTSHCENLLLLNEENSQNNNRNNEERQREMNIHDDDDGHLGGLDDDFDIPCTAGTNEPYFVSQNGQNEWNNGQSQVPDNMELNNPVNPDDLLNNLQRFDMDNLIEAPMQVNAINIEYAKTSKNIDVRRLKQVIWSLLNSSSDQTDKENIDDTLNTSAENPNKQRSADQRNLNASLKAIYKQLKPPLVTQKVYDDLSICIVFQMILFLANEHGLLLKNDPIGSDVIITYA